MPTEIDGCRARRKIKRTKKKNSPLLNIRNKWECNECGDKAERQKINW